MLLCIGRFGYPKEFSPPFFSPSAPLARFHRRFWGKILGVGLGRGLDQATKDLASGATIASQAGTERDKEAAK